MKKILLLSLLLMAMISAKAQLTFEPAVTPEQSYPSSMAEHFSHTSAHHLKFYADNQHVYVRTWDNGEALSGTSGMAVQEYIGGVTGTLVNEETIIFESRASLEAVMVESGNHEPYIVLTYYDYEIKRFQIDVYEWVVGVGLVQLPSYPQNLYDQEQEFGWIRNDMTASQELVITWESEGDLYLTGTKWTWQGFSLYGTNIITEFDFYQHDNALISTQGSEGYVYVVATNRERNNIRTYMFYFGEITDPTVSTLGIHIAYDDTQPDGIYYNDPRIGAPSSINSTQTAWSFVVQRYKNVDNVSEIVTVIEDNIYGAGLQEHILNNLSLPSSPFDISPNEVMGNPQVNAKPVVAFGDWFIRNPSPHPIPPPIYYGWYHLQGDPGISANLSTRRDGYIGLQMNADGQFYWDPDFYFVIPTDVEQTSTIPSLAFSGYEYSGFGLYAAYAQEDPINSGISFGYKEIPYSSNSFRPTDIDDMDLASLDVFAIPNPFFDHVSLQSHTDDHQGDLEVQVMDILGRIVFSETGDIENVNMALVEKSPNWESGMYVLKLRHKDGSEQQILKISKSK